MVCVQYNNANILNVLVGNLHTEDDSAVEYGT